MMNIQLINCNIFQQKVVDPLPPDKQVRKALQKKGYPPKAPKNSCGCKHYALSDMKTLSDTDVRFYTQCESKKDFFKYKCAHKGCKNGVLGTHWPIRNVVGDKIQAYWCGYALEDTCHTFFCVECAAIRLEKECSNKGNRNNRRGKINICLFI